MKTSALNLDTVRGTVQVAYDGVQHQPNLLVLTDEEIANLSDVSFEVGDVIDASSIQKAFQANCCCVYLKNWLRLGGDDVIIGGVTFKADGTQEGLVIRYEDIDWPGSEEEVILGDGSRMTLEDLAEDPSFSGTYIGQTGRATDVMLGNNTAITIANLENRIVSDKNLVNQSTIDTIVDDQNERWANQDVENNSTRSRLSSLESRLTTTNANVATNTQNIQNNTGAINTLGSTVASLGSTVSGLSSAVAGLGNQFVAKSGDTMTGELVVANSNYRTQVNGAGILVWDRNTSPTTATSITPNSVTSGSFILHSGTSDQILLGNGTTTSLSQITSTFGNYLPLTGGTLSGDVTLSRTAKIQLGGGTGDDRTIVRPNAIYLYDESNEKEVRISCWQGYLSVYDGPSSQYYAPIFCSGAHIYDNDNEETVTISCGDGSFVVYSDDLNDYGTVVCGGVQIPNATDGELVMATGQINSLYGLCGGSIHRTTSQVSNLYKKVYSTGFLNIYNIFGEDAIDNTVTSGRLNAEQSEVIREMYICNIMPTNIYYRFGDNSVATETSQYIPVGCRRGFAMGTYIFYFIQPAMQGIQIIRITVSIPDATSTLSWTKEVNDITISA